MTQDTQLVYRVARHGSQVTKTEASVESRFKNYKIVSAVIAFVGIATEATGTYRLQDIRSSYLELHPDAQDIPLKIQLAPSLAIVGGALLVMNGLVRHLVTSGGDMPTSMDDYAPGGVAIRQEFISSQRSTEQLPIT